MDDPTYNPAPSDDDITANALTAEEITNMSMEHYMQMRKHLLEREHRLFYDPSYGPS